MKLEIEVDKGSTIIKLIDEAVRRAENQAEREAIIDADKPAKPTEYAAPFTRRCKQ